MPRKTVLSSSSPRSSSQKKERRSSPFPSAAVGRGLQQIHERTTSVVVSVAGAVGQGYVISPAALLVAARMTGYRALADEVRLDLIRVHCTPILGASSTGRMVLYIERDPAAAAVATVVLANDQRERSVSSVRDPLSITWRPQEPADYEFNTLNPGTVSLGAFNFIGDQITDAAGAAFAGNVYNVQFMIAMTIRGRP